MKITDKATEKVFIMPKIDLKYINRAKKSELKVLYYIYMKNGDTDIEEISRQTDETVETVAEALAFWRCAGVIGDDESDAERKTDDRREEAPGEPSASLKEEKAQGTPTPKAPDSYTLSEIAAAKENDDKFGSLIDYFQKISGHLYNSAEQGIVLYLYDTLGIDCEVIMGVAQYCASMGKSSVRYIQKTVMNITESGVSTFAELESYLAGQKSKNEFRDKVKAIIGASNRALSKAENIHIDRWQKEFHSSEELVAYAYEKTVAKINKPQVSYMSKILESWYEKGLKTPSEVDSFFEKTQTVTATPQKDDGRLDFNLDDIFEKPDLG